MASPALFPNYAPAVPEAGCLGQTCNPIHVTSSLPTSGGFLYMCGLWLPANVTVRNLAVVVFTAATTPTHTWLGLYDRNRNQLAVTADNTGAVPTGLYKKPIATTAAGAQGWFTTTYEGLHYIGWMGAAATGAALYGPNGDATFMGALPSMPFGFTDGAQTTPPAFPHQAAAFSGNATPFYAYAAS